MPNPFSNPKVCPKTNDNSSMGRLETSKADDLDVPLALRKGVRSCTKHPISNYVSYLKLSPQFKAFTANIDDIVNPKDIMHCKMKNGM